MEHTFGNDIFFSRRELNGAALQINQEPTFDYIEEFVIVSMPRGSGQLRVTESDR
jgi:hypothetical protein